MTPSSLMHQALAALLSVTMLCAAPVALAVTEDTQETLADDSVTTAPFNDEALAADPVTAVSPEEASADAVPATLPHDLSPWGMFVAADWVVKAVMIGLVIASVVTWTIWLAKTLELAAARRLARADVEVLANADSLEAAAAQLKQPRSYGRAFAESARAELQQSGPKLPADGIKDRVNERLQRIEAAASRKMTQGTGTLATIGSTAPFVGLFGTVWGIMNSFIGIAETQTTNLAVVAPGIAEALLATGLGLLAAIPAVVIYNVFARSISGYRAQLGDASAAVALLVGRDLDRARSS